MKSSLLTLSFLLLALTVAFSKEGAEQVKDINGDPITPGRSFYIRPGISSPVTGGGVLLGRTGNYKCLATVLEEYSNVSHGLPVKFTIPGISSGNIFTGTPVDISFKERPIGECAELNSTKWALVHDDKKDEFVEGVRWIGIGGARPDKALFPGMFQIDKYDDLSYKIVFCSKVDDNPTSNACNDVVTFDYAEIGRRLVLNDTLHSNPYPIVFVHASGDNV